MTHPWHLTPDCSAEITSGLLCPRCLQASHARAEALRQQVRQARTHRLEDRRLRLRGAQARGREQRVGNASAVLHSPAPRRDTRIYVWGCGPIASRLLLERGRSTPEAREFARRRGWDAEQSGGWALELAVPVPLSAALFALESTFRGEASVRGYGGRTTRDVPSGWWGERVPPASGAAADAALDGIAPPALLRPSAGGPRAREDAVEAARGPERARSQELQWRVTAAMAQSRRLCESAAAVRGQARGLRSRPGETWQAFGPEAATPLGSSVTIGWTAGTPAPAAPDGHTQADLSLPEAEFAALNEVVTHAHDLAAVGCLSAGYTVLLAGRRRAEHAAAAGEEWAPRLVGLYHLSLENYIARYGARF